MIYKNNISDGIISGIYPFGIFIKTKNKDAFCHISNCSHKFIKNLNDEFKINSKVTFKILGVDDASGRMNVSIKEC